MWKIRKAEAINILDKVLNIEKVNLINKLKIFIRSLLPLKILFGSK